MRPLASFELDSRAVAHHGQEVLVAVRADDERMGGAGLARLELRKLRLEPVVERMVLDLDVDAEPPRDFSEMLDGAHVLFEPASGIRDESKIEPPNSAAVCARPPSSTLNTKPSEPGV